MSAIEVRIGDFVADHAAIRAIRFAVFVDEQHVPADIEMDERDPACIHLLAVGAQPVGTGRIDIAAGGKIGRVAVLAPYRGHGVGTKIMQRLHAVAMDAGLGGVWCNAQLGAAAFYEQLGYEASGGVFEEAGILHVRMQLTF